MEITLKIKFGPAREKEKCPRRSGFAVILRVCTAHRHKKQWRQPGAVSISEPAKIQLERGVDSIWK